MSELVLGDAKVPGTRETAGMWIRKIEDLRKEIADELIEQNVEVPNSIAEMLKAIDNAKSEYRKAREKEDKARERKDARI